MTVIRPGSLADIPALQAIEVRSARRFFALGMAGLAEGDPLPSDLLEARIRADRVRVAAGADGPVGFAVFDLVDGCAYVEELDVDPGHAGRRLGARLIDAVEAAARSLGLGALLLSTFRDVPWNAPYYRRLGFVDLPDETLAASLLAIRREHEARGLDESRRVFMRRDLAPRP